MIYPPLLSPLVQRAQAKAQFEVLASALELLESARITQRISGVYALEALARDDARARESVTEVLCALVRRRASQAHGLNGAAPDETVTGDVQAALAVLGRGGATCVGEQPLDLHGISLRGAFLPGANFAGAFLYDCDLEGALLQEACLRSAWLWHTNLRRANLDGADLRGADLSGARHLRADQLAAAICDQDTRLPTLQE